MTQTSIQAAPVDRSADGTPYEAPRGEAEVVVARIWQEVLHFERIGRNDNFFELGGNSQLAMTLLELLDERTGIQLPVVALFLNPTIREMTELGTNPP